MSHKDLGDVILGCSSGALVVLGVQNQPKSVVMIGKILIHESKPRFPETLIDKKTMFLPNRDEPITNIVAVKKGKKEDYLDYGHVLACTINGWVYLVNHLENQILKKLFLQDLGLTSQSLRLNNHSPSR
jgi:hypothetical protein